jgi:peroxiredoxin Q/BCP
MLQVGDPIPNFTLTSDSTGTVKASDLRGHRFVLYFYPKDDTTGCTAEACSFRDNLPNFSALNVPVYGISPDDVKSHNKFRAKYGLTFPLLADPGHEVADAFGTWVEKSMYGRKYMGIQRSTFVIGPDGHIEHVWEKVTPAEHAQEVLAYLNGTPTTAATGTPAQASMKTATKSTARAAKRPATKRRSAKKGAATKRPAKKAATRKTAKK